MLFRATSVSSLVPGSMRTPMFTFATSLPVREESSLSFSPPKLPGFPISDFRLQQNCCSVFHRNSLSLVALLLVFSLVMEAARQ